MIIFRDRSDAGRRLAAAVAALDLHDPVVLGLPRGGLPVAAEVAERLDAPLDVVVVRKIGAPSNPEYALGAIGEDGVELLDDRAVASLGLDRARLQPTIEAEREELERRLVRYRGDRRGVDVAGRTVVLVDDGIATGSTAAAAAEVLRARGAATVVLAVPVGPPRSIERLQQVFDRVVALAAPESFLAVGSWYEDFGQTTDEEVEEILAGHGERLRSRDDHARSPDDHGPVSVEVSLQVGGVDLVGDLTVPAGARGVVVFAHGSGSSRRSPRNRQVAAVLVAGGLATLLFDLLTEPEARDRRNVFDIGLLGRRLADTVGWVSSRDELRGLPVGLFGASTGAAAALNAAAARTEVRAVVSRGGRPDLSDRLDDVHVPVLLIVGGDDRDVLGMNQEAARHLADHRIAVVPGAGHLFEGPGQLEQVADLARDWFLGHLPTRPGARVVRGRGAFGGA